MMDVRLLPAPLRGGDAAAVQKPAAPAADLSGPGGEFPCPPDPLRRCGGHGPGAVGLVSRKGPRHRLRGQRQHPLRFLLPLAMARGQVGTVFTGTERLLERPLPGTGALRPRRAVCG